MNDKIQLFGVTVHRSIHKLLAVTASFIRDKIFIGLLHLKNVGHPL